MWERQSKFARIWIHQSHTMVYTVKSFQGWKNIWSMDVQDWSRRGWPKPDEVCIIWIDLPSPRQEFSDILHYGIMWLEQVTEVPEVLGMELLQLLRNSGAAVVLDVFMNKKWINFFPFIFLPFKNYKGIMINAWNLLIL